MYVRCVTQRLHDDVVLLDSYCMAFRLLVTTAAWSENTVSGI